MDVEHTERGESELHQLIERRAQKSRDADEEHELWKASVARYNGKRRKQNREAWYEFHLSQAEAIERTAVQLATDYRGRAEALAEKPKLPGAWLMTLCKVGYPLHDAASCNQESPMQCEDPHAI